MTTMTLEELRLKIPGRPESFYQRNAIDGSANAPRTVSLALAAAPGSSPARPQNVTQGPRAPRLRQRSGDGMNKTERAYREEIVRAFPGALIYREPALPIANGCVYKLDFLVANMTPTGLAVLNGFEVKGFMRDDAAVKIKVAAVTFPWIKFWLVSKRKKKHGGGWNIQHIHP